MQKGTTVFAVGGVGYGGVELLYRGYTHWTMMVTGGICLLLLCGIATRLHRLPLWLQAVLGGICVTAIELAIGLIVNVWLGWDVWDYSNASGNLWGQICPLFTVYWMLLSGGVLGVLRLGRHQWAKQRRR